MIQGLKVKRVAPGPVSKHADDAAIDRFTVRMKDKMALGRACGRGGWNDPLDCSTATLSELLHAQVAKGDPVDLANYAMMLSERGSPILAQGQTDTSPSHSPTLVGSRAGGAGYSLAEQV